MNEINKKIAIKIFPMSGSEVIVIACKIALVLMLKL
jgi:hypothetical protein